MDKIQELLKPRILCIKPDTSGKFKEGDIFYKRDLNVGYVYVTSDFEGFNGKVLKAEHGENFPHLFRKLEWWEMRKVEEMPEYLKFHDGEVIKVNNWNIETLCCEREDGGGCNLDLWAKGYGYFPSTEQEYLTYINNQLNK